MTRRRFHRARVSFAWSEDMKDVSQSRERWRRYRRWLSQFDRIYWPRIVDRTTARRAAAQGAAMDGFSAIVTLAVIFWNTFYPVIPIFAEFNLDHLLDVATCTLLAWLIYWRLSRVAAVISLGYYIAGQVLFFSHHPEAHPDFRLLIYSLMLINGIRGTFAYWRYRSVE